MSAANIYAEYASKCDIFSNSADLRVQNRKSIFTIMLLIPTMEIVTYFNPREAAVFSIRA